MSLGGNANGNVDMGNYLPARLSEQTLRQIYFWARDDIGFRLALQSRIAANCANYIVTVLNNGMQGKGLAAEGVTVNVIIPQGVTVMNGAGPGYQGVRTEGGNSVAVWTLPALAPKETQNLTLTLSRPATAQDNLRGTVRWAKPAPKAGPSQDVIQFALPAA